MGEFYCIASIECMTSGKCLLNCTNLFSPKEYKKNDKIIYLYIIETNMGKENVSLDFRLKKVDETRNKTQWVNEWSV